MRILIPSHGSGGDSFSISDDCGVDVGFSGTGESSVADTTSFEDYEGPLNLIQLRDDAQCSST